MIDGFKTSSLALDVHQLANKLGVDISPKAVYINIEGLIFGFTDRVDVTTGEIRNYVIYTEAYISTLTAVCIMLILSGCLTCAVC